MLEWFDEQLGTIQKRDENSDKGGTMRLGAYSCNLTDDTFASAAYAKKEISEKSRPSRVKTMAFTVENISGMDSEQERSGSRNKL